jgi:hypothetical protein
MKQGATGSSSLRDTLCFPRVFTLLTSHMTSQYNGRVKEVKLGFMASARREGAFQ